MGRIARSIKPGLKRVTFIFNPARSRRRSLYARLVEGAATALA